MLPMLVSAMKNPADDTKSETGWESRSWKSGACSDSSCSNGTCSDSSTSCGASYDDDLSAESSLPSKETKGKGKASSNRCLNHAPFTMKQFKEVCASDARPLRFVAIRSGGYFVQDSIIPIAIDRSGSLGVAIKTDADGAVVVKKILPTALEPCKKLRPGDVLAYPTAVDFPTTDHGGDSSSIKHPTIEVIYKKANDAEIPVEKEKEVSLKGDISLSSSTSHRSVEPSSTASKVDNGASNLDASSTNNLDASPSNQIVEDAAVANNAVNDDKETTEKQEVSPPLAHTNSARDECAESLCSIPIIEAIVKSSKKTSGPAPARNLQDASKMRDPPTNAKIHQPNSRPNGQSKAHIVKSRVVPFNSKQSGMEEEYFKEIAAKSAEGSEESIALFGKLPRLEGPRLIRFPIFPSGALPSTTSSGVDQSNGESKLTDAGDTKPNEVETSAREAPDADQECDADKALASATDDSTTCTTPANDGPFSGMRALASQYLSNLQESKDERMGIAAIFNFLADEKGQDQTNRSDEHRVGEDNELSPIDSASLAGEYTGEEDLQNPKDQAVKSIDSASTCIRYSVKASKGIKKTRTRRRKKKKS